MDAYIGVPQTEGFHFFYGGVFSNWYLNPFDLDGNTWDCVEQYMMFQKAALFGDFGSMLAIRGAKEDPRRCKALGRKVTGYDDDQWTQVCQMVVYRACMAKFSQSGTLKEAILKTSPKLLVEASPYDTRWGVGLAATDPSIQEQGNWKGTNWLGAILTLVREDMK